MHARSLPASPNWYSSRCSDVSSGGLLGVGAKNVIHLIEVSSASCRVTGELAGHRDLVSGFSFCQHPEQSHICVSSSTDGNVYFWDSNNKTLIRRNAAHQNPISGLHWSPADKNLVVSGDEKGVVVCHWFHTGDTASFFPEPRTIFCLTCSPHSWKSVAVGYKDGMIAIIDVSKKGEVMQRLRGHDNEIHSLAWSPLIGEDALYTRAEDHQATNEGLKGEESGCYVASGSKDQTVRIWSTAKGKGVMTLKLPFLKRRGSAVDPGVKERIWLNVHWPKGRPTQLVSSCFSGELAMWDLTNTGKQKWSLFGSLSEGQNHSRIVFNMSSVQLQDGRELLISTSMDREIKCWDLNSLSCCWTLPTLGGHVYTLSFSPVGVGCLALGVGDNMIRVWNTLSGQNQYDIRSFWQSIKSKVTALAWHPKKEGSLAFGTDDGKVGIYDVFINKPPQISSSYHRKTVYTLTWGPPVPPLSFGAEGKQTYSLYSCAGEGVILQHDPGRLNEEASDINKLISDTNNIQHKLSPHTDLSWKPDGKVVAIGNEDGSIDVYQGPSLKLLCSIQQHHKIINTLRWQHDHGSAPELHCLLASGSSNAIVYVHDLRSVIESPPETPVLLTEPYRRLCGHTGKITSMAWSPHHSARLVTASYDSTAQVWDVLEEAAISNYRGHTGYLLCVDWSPVDPDVIWTGGKDFTVQEWKVSEQEFTKPPKGKKMVLLQDKKQRKKSKPASVSTESVELKINGESVTEGKKAIAEQGLSEEEEEVRSTNGVESPGLAFQMQKKSTPTAKSKDKPAPDLTKKKKPRSMLPLSTSMDHRPKEELLQDCVTLASVRHSAESPAGCVPGQGEYIHLGLFHDRKALHCMFEAEEESHLEAGHYDSVVYLRLWSGDLQGALQLATERGELNDHLLSIAPMAGFQVWSRTVEAFVKQLCLHEQFLKAASHLLSINKLYEAVDLLRSNKLYREAIALVKARLPADEPLLKELYTCWAAVLEKDGHLSAAAKCYLGAGCSFDAAKVIAKKNDVPSLRTAADLARISGEVVLAQSLVLRCSKDMASAQDWVGAQEVLSSQTPLLAHRLHLCTAELLTVTLADCGVLSLPSSTSSHPWATLKGCNTLQERVIDIWEQEFHICRNPSEDQRVKALLQELKSVETPARSASMSLKQILLYASVHLTRSLLGWLLNDGEMVPELWQAAAWLGDAGNFGVSASFCRLLFPDGDVRVFSSKHSITLQQSEAESSSLQAFVCYHRLYERWWKNCPLQNGNGPREEQNSEARTAETSESKGGVCLKSGSPTDLDFEPAVLLSEPHAHSQGAQRSMREIQEQLSAMVLQHCRVQDGQPEAGNKQDGSVSQTASSDQHEAAEVEKRSEQHETFLSLSSKLSKMQEEVSNIPNTIKTFPRPDVVECCLVLLHLSKSFSISHDLQQQARDLLRKYGTSPSLVKASRGFLA